jgi:peptide chain release factor subunit 1
MITAETIQRLTDIPANRLPVVSAYIRVPPEDTSHRLTNSTVSSLLHEIRTLVDDKSLDREVRLSLRRDLAQIEDVAAAAAWQPHAVALFSSSGRDLFEQITLPRAVRNRIVIDATPWTRPLLAVLDEYHRSVVAVLDRANAWFWEMFQSELREIDRSRDPVLRKTNYAGWHGLEEHRVSDKARELERRHFGQISEILSKLIQSGTYDVAILGGHPDETARFLAYLPKSLRTRVVGQFAVDPNTMKTADVAAKASEILDEYERQEERTLVEDVLERAGAGPLGVTGLDKCLWAGSTAAIERLLVHDETIVSGCVCDACGWLGRDGAATCPLSGDVTRKTADIIDELAASVIDHAGTVEHVFADTPLREHGVAAALRFPLPPPPS